MAIVRRTGTRRTLTTLAAAGAALSVTIGSVAAFGQARTGPSSSAPPYVVPSRPGVTTVSLLTVGDAVPHADSGVRDYRLAGIPDGLGAYDNGDGTFTLLANHEIPAGEGAVREHGAAGAFVSKWTIDKKTFEVLAGEDLIERVALAPAGVYAAPALGVTLSRLCSGDLPEGSALYDAATGLGYPGRVFMSGEEAGAEGRAFAHVLDGTSYELPALGKMSWENLLANPATGDATVVVGLDDSRPGQVYVYAGGKQATGNPAERAGLAGGRLYGIKVDGAPFEPATGFADGTRFTVSEIETPALKTGAQIEAESNAELVTRWARPEDGFWNPADPSEFLWITTGMAPTGGFPTTNPNRLWKFTFDDPAQPHLGGTIDMLLDGTEGPVMMDNLTVDHGIVTVQEDPGENDRLAKIWSYSLAADRVSEIAEHAPAFFAAGAPAFKTTDEESSGVIALDEILGKGWYALDSQVHADLADPELVEDGQLLLMRVRNEKNK